MKESLLKFVYKAIRLNLTWKFLFLTCDLLPRYNARGNKLGDLYTRVSPTISLLQITPMMPLGNFQQII